jgi:hypothetical protein
VAEEKSPHCDPLADGANEGCIMITYYDVTFIGIIFSDI